MSQKEINSAIDTLFDEFIKSGGDIDKMKIDKAKNVTFSNSVDFCDDNQTHDDDDEPVTYEQTKTTEFNKSSNIDETNEYTDTELKTYFNDQTQKLDFTNSFTGDLLNNFLIYFKKKNNKPKNFTLLDGIDTNDLCSTNMPLEEMFFELNIFTENEKNNPKFCEVIPFDKLDKSTVNSDELYCILIDGDPILASQSFFALLLELTNIKHEDLQSKKQRTYDIVSLK